MSSLRPAALCAALDSVAVIHAPSRCTEHNVKDWGNFDGSPACSSMFRISFRHVESALHVCWNIELEAAPTSPQRQCDQSTTRRGILKELTKTGTAEWHTLLDNEAFRQKRSRALQTRLDREALSPVPLMYRMVAGVREQANRAAGSMRQLLPKKALSGLQLHRRLNEESASPVACESARTVMRASTI